MAFVKLQHKNTNSIGGFVLKNGFKRSVQRFLVYRNKSDSDMYNK